MNRICLTVVVWGDRYVKNMLEYVIPSLLSPGNIPALSNKGYCELLIWTSEENEELIENSSQILALREHVDVKLKAYPKFFFSRREYKIKYQLMSILYRGIIEYAEETGSGLFFIPSDAVWADGSFKNIQAIIDRRSPRVIVMGSLRSDSSTIVPELSKFTSDLTLMSGEKVSQINVSSRDLVGLALEYQHAETASRYFTSPKFTVDPGQIYWDLDGRGILSRAVHLHPVYVSPERYDTDFDSTYDADFLQRAVPNIEDYYICDDSDEMFFTDLTAPDSLDAIPKSPNFAHELQIVEWYLSHINTNHLHFLRHPIWMHTGIQREEFSSIVTQSDFFIAKLVMYHNAEKQMD